ncbi:hypothetical protein BUMB_04305c [Candidatus Paraburkholderia calva]|nr:hypothetical protein BUMB_04305c [Candidatus Paraburkholderia calva]
MLGVELVPLCMYFSVLYRVGGTSLSHTAIDSVYYFGFIVTILSLAGSVMRVWLFGIEKDMSGLIAQFGVDLLATGLALVFRLVLTARVESLNAKDLSEMIAEYVQRIDGVVSKVEASAASFEGLSQSLQDRMRAVVESTFDECTTSMRSATTLFSKSITKISEQTSQSVERFGEVVESVAMASHVEHFDRQVSELSAGLKAFATEVSQYGRLTTEEALRTLKQALDASSKWHIDNLNTIAQASQELMRTALAALAELNLSVDTSAVKTDLQTLSRAVTLFTRKFGELEEKLAVAHARDSAPALEPIVKRFADQLMRTTGEVEVKALAQFHDASACITDETAKGIASVSRSAQVETKQQIDTLNGHIDWLITALDRTASRVEQQPALTAALSGTVRPFRSLRP